MSLRPRSRCPLSRMPLAPLYAHFAPARSRVPPILVLSFSHPSPEPGKSRSLSHIPGPVFLDPSPNSQSQFLVPSSRSCSRSQSHMPAPIPGPCPVFSGLCPQSWSLFPFPVSISDPSIHSRSLSPLIGLPPPPPPLRRPPRPHVTGQTARCSRPSITARDRSCLHGHALWVGAVSSQFLPSIALTGESPPNCFPVLSGSIPLLSGSLRGGGRFRTPPGQSAAAFECRHRPARGESGGRAGGRGRREDKEREEREEEEGARKSSSSSSTPFPRPPAQAAAPPAPTASHPPGTRR